MDSLDLIRAFREVATLGSFSRAATRLGLSKGTTSKYVAELESRFGVRLLNRSTRSVSLTDAGELLLERSEPMLEMVALTQAELTHRATRAHGRLRIAAPHAMGSSGELPALLAEFMHFYPEVRLSLHLTTHQVDLAEDGIDVELRFGPVENENLIIRKLLQMPMTVCAAPSYWQQRGMPNHPSELAEHDALTLIREGSQPLWHFEDQGQPLAVRVRSRMEATEGTPLVEVALHGFGMIYVPALAVQPHIDSGQLVPALQAYARQDMWVSAAYLQRRHNSAALRALLDYLQDKAKHQGRFAPKSAAAP